MRIYDFQHFTSQKHVTLQVRVELGTNKDFLLWFRTDLQHQNLVAMTADCFALAMVPVAMSVNEELVIEAPVTKQLGRQLSLCVDLMSSWPQTDIWPGLNTVNIVTPQLVSPPFSISKQRSRAAFFSLGLDSFFTLQETEKTPTEKLSHLLFVAGFDVALENVPLSRQVVKNCQLVSQATGKKLIVVETNVRQLTDSVVSWDIEHGCALAGVAYFLAQGLESVYINSEDAIVTGYPYGIHADLGPLWSTALMNIPIYGMNLKRSDKTRFIKDNALAQRYLRVCWENRGNQYNCSLCPKCLRTMLQLRAVGALEAFPVFKKRIPIEALEGIVEPKQRLFLWPDLLKSLPASDWRYRLAIVKLLGRSYWSHWVKTPWQRVRRILIEE